MPSVSCGGSESLVDFLVCVGILSRIAIWAIWRAYWSYLVVIWSYLIVISVRAPESLWRLASSSSIWSSNSVWEAIILSYSYIGLVWHSLKNSSCSNCPSGSGRVAAVISLRVLGGTIVFYGLITGSGSGSGFWSVVVAKHVWFCSTIVAIMSGSSSDPVLKHYRS